MQPNDKTFVLTIAIRRDEDGLYAKAPGMWVEGLKDARRFANTREAFQFCKHHDLRKSRVVWNVQGIPEEIEWTMSFLAKCVTAGLALAPLG